MDNQCIPLSELILVDQVQGLRELLAGFNNYFVPYAGSSANTRLLVDYNLRHRGLLLTYVRYDKRVVLEYYDSDDISDTAWRDNNNWRNASNRLVGDISVSQEGNWIISGRDTGVRATGQDGISPLIRWDVISTEYGKGHLEVSYNGGDTWLEISPVLSNYDLELTTGDNPRTVMSQKAITTALNEVKSDLQKLINYLGSDLSEELGLTGRVNNLENQVNVINESVIWHTIN